MTEHRPHEHSRADAARRSLPAHFRDKSALTDTAGTPWAGRDYAVSPFPDDDGRAPRALADALAARHRGEDQDLRGLAAALRGTRVLVPIMAVATEHGETAHGLVGDNGADMAMVTLEGPGGEKALPLFSSVEALAAWRRDARPAPVVAEQAAQAAVQEGCTALLLDPASGPAPADAAGADPAESRPTPVLLRRSILWALAQGRVWVPPAEDPAVLAELDALAAALPEVIALRPAAGAAREVDLHVRLVPGLDPEAVRAVVARLGEALGRSVVVAERITSLRLTLEG
ncbi:SseB family protein [Brachybacterium huguangmaarense]|uniref:SseB family protein n=1 Tax=Brachybacterium huguangmaarense TaxID=1652028 RepID=A0ABY6FXL2_9MICO|nr:SseB family protein [Brachybacterium huguangmaarense]UYG15587.1 SseB family protein [Brachybacterium huguangmaarense]